ncbi:hypothetical protein NL676_018061 [Syzygium grande]|nr:hypothetical protein NL676_018061 [Syzygium grande]
MTLKCRPPRCYLHLEILLHQLGLILRIHRLRVSACPSSGSSSIRTLIRPSPKPPALCPKSALELPSDYRSGLTKSPLGL